MSAAIQINRLALERPLIAGRFAARFGEELAAHGALRYLGAIITPPLALDEDSASAWQLREVSRRGSSLLLPPERAWHFDRAAQSELPALRERMASAGCTAIIPIAARDAEAALRLAERIADEVEHAAILVALDAMQGDALAQALETIVRLRAELDLPIVVELPQGSQAFAKDALDAGADAAIACALPAAGLSQNAQRTLLTPYQIELALSAMAQACKLGAEGSLIFQGAVFTLHDAMRALAAGASAISLNESLFSNPALARSLHADIRDALKKHESESMELSARAWLKAHFPTS